MTNVTATVEQDEHGNFVLNDPDGLAMLRAVEKHNCKVTFDMNAERIVHFRKRLQERGDDPKDVLIVIINVDDVHGGPLADTLMPGHDWQPYRDHGETPYARGLVGREGIQSVLPIIDEAASDKLARLDGLAVVVVDRGVAEVFSAAQD